MAQSVVFPVASSAEPLGEMGARCSAAVPAALPLRSSTLAAPGVTLVQSGAGVRVVAVALLLAGLAAVLQRVLASQA